MCNNCFLTEVTRFGNARQWESFDLELSNKLGQGKLQQIEVVNRLREYGEEESFYVYQCSTCGQKWELEEPGDQRDGHFLMSSTSQQLARTQLSNRQLVVLVLLVVIIYVAIRVITW